MTPAHRPNARLTTVRCLEGVFNRGMAVADHDFAAGGLEPRDQAYARHLAFGVLRWFGALDWLASRLLQKPLKSRDRDVRLLILLGLFQLWREDTPAHAAVHANAEVARMLNKAWAVGLVNAVLRRFQREQGAWLDALSRNDARWAHPDWLLGRLRSDWPEQWTELVESNNRQAPLWLRINQRRGDRQSAARRLADKGFKTTAHPLAPQAVAIDPAVPVSDIPGFSDGLLSVQDAAAQLAAPLLACQPGDRVLDACAAPGGKACHLLESPVPIQLTLMDQSESRLVRVRENLERLQLEAVPLCADAAEPDQWWDGTPYQRILLDAPCSATGVIRRHPEIKWLRDGQQVERAVAQQRQLLDRLWPLLDAGGMLVYATCSVLRIENDQQIEGFIRDHGDARCTGPAFVTTGLPVTAGFQIPTGQDDADGFYYAVLQKHS